MSLVEYFKYARLQQDEEPLYIFDEQVFCSPPLLCIDPFIRQLGL